MEFWYYKRTVMEYQQPQDDKEKGVILFCSIRIANGTSSPEQEEDVKRVEPAHGKVMLAVIFEDLPK